MKSAVDWLFKNKLWNALILLIYYLAVVLPHKKFGAFLNGTVIKFLGINNNTPEGRQQYNVLAISIALIILIAALYYFFKALRTVTDRTKILSLMVFNILLAAIIVRFLFVVNIEFIHFPQYAVFAILIFPIIGNYQSTLIWTTLFGMLDEAYQYFYLAPKDTSYYDFNDVLTNLVGAVFGLLLLRAYKIEEFAVFRLRTSSFRYGILLIVLLIAGLHFLDILSIYPSDEHVYHIVRELPGSFWSKAHPNVVYHVVRPLEGTLLTIILWIFYGRLITK